MVVISNPHAVYGSGMSSSPDHHFAITPSDTDDLAYVTRAISFDADATVNVTLLGGTTVVVKLAGMVQHAMRATRIWATTTTAVNIVGWY